MCNPLAPELPARWLRVNADLNRRLMSLKFMLNREFFCLPHFWCSRDAQATIGPSWAATKLHHGVGSVQKFVTRKLVGQ